jgi:uncharacterized membrane protein (DUF4010 family)
VVQRELPASGLYVVAALAGLTDVDAIALSMAESARTMDSRLAATAIVIAAVTNTVVKCALVLTLGARPLKRPVVLAAVAVLASGILAIMLI